MSRLLGAVALLAAAWADWAAAQEFQGAELSAELLTFNGGDDVTSNNYGGSVEFGLYDAFSVAADLSFYDFEDGEGVRNVTLHALYKALPMVDLGAFYARDSSQDRSSHVFGVEASRSFGAASVDGYVGFGDEENQGFTTLGLNGSVAVTRGISLRASGAAADRDGGGISRLSVGGEYRFGETGPAVYADIGRQSAEDDAGLDDSTSFIGVGGRIAIGPNQGTTFGSRGLHEILGRF